MTKLLVAGLAVLAAVAVADTIRRESAASTAPSSASAPPQRVVHPVTSGFVAVGPGTRTRVLLNGREYVSARQVDAAFPAPLEGVPFDIAHVASASDGTVALAVYKIPVTG
ncbi:MAG TPA: hypothetical protein VG709_07125, partial [Actinomycetota bacterium]|nr:hypothetical protein [Actinomycetota bacterium]